MYKIMRVVALLQPLTWQHYTRWIFIRSQFRTATTTAEIRRLNDKEIESSPYPYILHLYLNGFTAYSRGARRRTQSWTWIGFIHGLDWIGLGWIGLGPISW